MKGVEQERDGVTGLEVDGRKDDLASSERVLFGFVTSGPGVCPLRSLVLRDAVLQGLPVWNLEHAGGICEKEFTASLDSAGYKNLGVENLVRLRDHGVDGDYIADMKEMGYAPSNPEELIESRDHGVDPSYIRSLKEARYERLSLQELRRARDHGVTRGFIQRVKARGYGNPSLDEVIRLRDRGLE